ncbi:MAG: transglutaminase domain-containing protein [Planctomycetes bacterium]|nr:transglutaminase domain-containing protein [Planctomycetota bacterium]
MNKLLKTCVCAITIGSSLLTSAGSILAEDNSCRSLIETEGVASIALTDAVTYEVDFSAVVTPPYHADILKVWMPIPQTDIFQQVTDSKLTTFPAAVVPQIDVEPVHGNKFAYFEFHKPLGAQIIRHRFTATVRNARWNLDPSLVQLPEKWPQDMVAYLKPDTITEAAGFQAVIQDIAPQRSTSVNKLFAAMSWIDKNLTYGHNDSSLRADADHAFTKRHGNCSDYHGLCATMGRTLGFPTRVTYGLALFPKNSPSHCKLEAFLPPYGWVSFDLSETQKMIAAIGKNESLGETTKAKLATSARLRLTKGFRENSWLLVTKGTNYELVPKASQPVHVVRTIYAEADGEALPEPDPANKDKREFGWMTIHAYKSNKPVSKPFKDLTSLESE